jgi:crotonobetainyl-CoA:carnitine CoA-transferase CaiB-like acyl-CoA transferase
LAQDEALGDVKVVEFGGYAAGPAIGKHLANFGARVVHVESQARPDGFRLEYPPWKDDRVEPDMSGCFSYFNDSKHAVTLDLKSEDGRALARRLAAWADVIIENMRPGVMARLGLAPERLLEEKPSLVVLSTTNLGQTGPYATHPGFGSQLSSLSGFTELIGRADGPPNFIYGPYIDLIAVAFGGAVVLAALDHGRRTGQGAVIDLSQYETGLQFLGGALLDYAANGAVAHRNGNHDPNAVPHGCYPCRGGGWCVISCWDDDEWRRLGEATGEGWATDSRFAAADGRRAHEGELDERLAGWTRARTDAEVMTVLQAAGVHAGAVRTMKDLFEDPQLASRSVWQQLEHRSIGPQRYRMVSYQLSKTPGRVSRPAPCLGQDNDLVFRQWLGLGAEEYEELAARGAFA